MTHWLDIIGVTEAGIEALPAHQLNLLGTAKTILGPKRLVANLPPRKSQVVQHWKSGIDAMIEQVRSYRETSTVILATGDPNWFGIGATISRHLEPSEFAIHPAPSAFQLAAATMRWSLQSTVTLSLHGRPAQNLHPHILPGNCILALTSNAKTLNETASILVARGYGKSMLTVLENLGGTNERSLTFSASKAEQHAIGDFYTLAIECVADIGAPLLPTIPGLSDTAFINDGQLTKRQVRAATLAALAPTPGALLWDVGAGCGSIGIEWMRAATNATAICFEQNSKRAATISQNASALGVPTLKTITGAAPECIERFQDKWTRLSGSETRPNKNLEPGFDSIETGYIPGDQTAPDAIFIGGAVADDAVFEYCWDALLPGGRLVANAVTLAGQSALISRQKQFGGELVSIAISTLASIGTQSILKPALPVTQWIIRKP